MPAANPTCPAPSQAAGQRHRPVRSFVLREGRMTAGQERAFRELWPRFGVDWKPGQPLNPAAVFADVRPITLEIGFGDGESLSAMAAAAPERGFIGLEVHRPGIGHLLLAAERLELENLRVLRADAWDLLQSGLPRACLERVQLFFPDPWPKRRHNKRRIVQPAFAAAVARALQPGGHLHMATDWEPYAEQMLEVLTAADELFENCSADGRFCARPATRPVTKFERRGQRLGHRVHDLIFQRR